MSPEADPTGGGGVIGLLLAFDKTLTSGRFKDARRMLGIIQQTAELWDIDAQREDLLRIVDKQRQRLGRREKSARKRARAAASATGNGDGKRKMTPAKPLPRKARGRLRVALCDRCRKRYVQGQRNPTRYCDDCRPTELRVIRVVSGGLPGLGKRS